MIPLYEASTISEVTGVPEENVRRVLRYINMTEGERVKRQQVAEDRESHDL